MVPLRLGGVGRTAARERANALLERVELTERARYKPNQMSGGQQRHVAIARALVHNPPLVIADEPTAHLDYVQMEGILRLIREIADEGRLVVVATHDDRITDLADQVVELVPHRRVVEQEPVTVELETGELLFRQGDPSDLVYVVGSGRIQLFREREDGTEEHIVVVGTSKYFGELGPMLSVPRRATARAAEPSTVVGYSLKQFKARHAKPKVAGV